MEPYQPPAQTPPNGQQPQYDFITNPAKPRKKSFFSGGGGKGKPLIMIAAGMGVLLLIIILATLFAGGDSDKQVVLNVVRKQSEVIAVAKLGAKEGGTSQTQGLGLAVQLSVTTEQQALLAQLAKKGKVDPKDYVAGVSTEVQTQLDNAQRNGRFDEAFTTAIKQELTEYQQQLQTANASVTSNSTKELLAQDFKSAGILLSIPTN